MSTYLDLSVLRLLLVGHDVQMGEVYFRLPGTNGLHAKAKIERFTAAGSRCRQNLKNEYYHVVVWQTTSKYCTKKRASRAARLFFFIQSIKSLIF